MSSSTSNSSLARSRSLRSNSLKPSSSLNPNSQTATPAPGPSNVALFLTNLRLLELDLRDDWPDITAVTFSTSARQENQKKRIQCVEWALYRLFELWDPQETRNVRLAVVRINKSSNPFIFRSCSPFSRLSNLYNLSTSELPCFGVSTKRRRMEYWGGIRY
jgi:hypothetical protein